MPADLPWASLVSLQKTQSETSKGVINIVKSDKMQVSKKGKVKSTLKGYLVAQPNGIFRLGQGEEEARIAAGESVIWSCPVTDEILSLQWPPMNEYGVTSYPPLEYVGFTGAQIGRQEDKPVK
ncbi:hypothetical protein E5288_WYG021422 [Bos mutus]|uniref:Uncharacterized protein n=1 Tax=Bos mutus TaxID=72004 RepID=A0A6B0SED6_9CETA|nr:hypothetical protein [Bos mutus]